MRYKVDITDEALQDMEDIYNYIAIELMAPDNAINQYNRIADAILTLDTVPERCKIMDSVPEKKKGLHRAGSIPVIRINIGEQNRCQSPKSKN